MLSRVEPCHRLLEHLKPDATLREVAFSQAFGRDLAEAWEWLQCYHKVQVRSAIDIDSAIQFERGSTHRMKMHCIKLGSCTTKLFAGLGKCKYR